MRSSLRRLRLASVVVALFAFGLLPNVVRAGAVTGSGSINCTSDLPAYGALDVTQAMSAGTSGSLTLGGDNNKFIGACSLTGTIPTGWTVEELSGADLAAAPGSGNGGTFTWDTDDSSFADSGTFDNSGTFVDESDGFTQEIDVADFLNTGTVRSQSTGLVIGGTSPSFDDRGAVEVAANDSFELAGTFVLDTGGTMQAVGVLDIAGSTFEVRGGAVTSGVLTSPYRLGLGPSAISFAAGVPASSTGTIEVQVPTTLSGIVAKGWTLALSSSVTAQPGSGNAGTIDWTPATDNATFSDTTTFANTGTFGDAATGYTQQITARTFSNTGLVYSRAPGFGLGGSSPMFVDQGRVQITGKGAFALAGTFMLDAHGTIQAGRGLDIAGSTFEVRGGSITSGVAISPYHLGVGPTTISFPPGQQPGSRGTVNVQVPIKVIGNPPVDWKLKLDGGQITH
jgi:hypothetical protein